MTLSPFQIAAPKLRFMGYSVIPILPHSKRPAVEAWTDFGVTSADEAVFSRWMNWKEMNVGIALGIASNLIIADLDNDVDDLHKRILSILPKTPLMKKGKKGISLFYQFNGQKSQGFSKKGERVLDILSQGRQSLVPPSWHPDGMQYEYVGGHTPEEIPASELPHVSIQMINEIGEMFITKLHVPSPVYTQVYADTTTDEISAALEYIDSDDYSTFVSVGMCLKDKLGERGFELWNKWSSTSTKYKQSEMRGKWSSFKNSGMTIASLFSFAMDAGYINIPTHDFLDPIEEDFIINGKRTGSPKAEIIAVEFAPIAEPPKVTDSLVFPSELLHAPGLPGKLAEFIGKTSLMPQPVLALGAAIAAAGSLMGRKVRGDTNLRTNFYVIGLAPSGSGKDHARTVIKRLFHDTGIGNLELGVPASSAGLISGLRDRGEGRGLILWDEFGRVLKQISGWKSGSHEKDIVTALMELFSSAQSVYLGKSYANHDNKNPLKPIDQPCLSIYATSVPTHFYEALSGGEAIDGFLARWLIFESKDYTMEEEAHEEVFSQAPQHMVDICKYWREQPFNTEENTGNLSGIIKTVPRLVESTPQAAAYLKDFATEMRKLAMTSELNGDVTGPIWSRAGEHARRLALVGVEGDQISLKAAEWGAHLARFCCKYMASAIGDYVSSTELESQTKRILRAIKDKSKKTDTWVTRADISRAFQGIQARTRNEILMSLIERGEVIEQKIPSEKGRPSFRYRANP